TGVNTFTGATTVNAGTLSLTGSGALGATAVNVNGGTLQIWGTGGTGTTTIGTGSGGSVTVNSGALSLQNGGINTLSISSGSGNTGLTLNGGAINFDLGATPDQILLGTSLATGGGTITINVNGLGG